MPRTSMVLVAVCLLLSPSAFAQPVPDSDEAQLEKWLRDPTSQKPTAHMPRLALTDDETRALARSLASLR